MRTLIRELLTWIVGLSIIYCFLFSVESQDVARSAYALVAGCICFIALLGDNVRQMNKKRFNK